MNLVNISNMFNHLNFSNNPIIPGLKDYSRTCLIAKGMIIIEWWTGLKNISIDIWSICLILINLYYMLSGIITKVKVVRRLSVILKQS